MKAFRKLISGKSTKGKARENNHSDPLDEVLQYPSPSPESPQPTHTSNISPTLEDRPTLLPQSHDASLGQTHTQRQQHSGKDRCLSNSHSSLIPNSRSASRASVLSHGRGPLMPESDDESSDIETYTPHLTQNDRCTALRNAPLARSRTCSSQKSLEAQRSIICRSSSTLETYCSNEVRTRRPVRLNMRTCCVWCSLSTVTLAFALFAVVHLWLGNIVSEQFKSGEAPREMIHRGLLSPGAADEVAIAAIDGNIITLSLTGKLGQDVRQTLGWEHKDMSNATVWQRVESRVARWFVGTAQNVRVTIPGPVRIRPLYYSVERNVPEQSDTTEQDMLEALVPSFDMPITYPTGFSSEAILDQVAKPIHLQLPIDIVSSERLKGCLTTAWKDRQLDIAVSIHDVQLQLNYSQFPPFIRSLLQKRTNLTMHSIYKTMTLNVPELPPILQDPTRAVRVDGYSFFPLASTTNLDTTTHLGIRAKASIPNPLLQSELLSRLNLNMEIPWQFPLQVYLELPPESNSTNHSISASSTTESIANSPSGVLMASVMTVPFTLNQTEQRLSLTIEGSLLNPDAIAKVFSLSGALSTFLDRFLKGLSTDVSIRYDTARARHSPTPLPRPSVMKMVRTSQLPFMSQTQQMDLASTNPPPFLETLLGSLDVRLPFPGTSETQILQNITIKEMSFSLSGATMICSGVIHGILSLPAEMQSLSEMLNITEIYPEVLVFDGGLPPPDGDVGEDNYIDILSEPSGRSHVTVPESQFNPQFSPDELDWANLRGTDLFDGDEPPSIPYPPNAFAKLVPPDYVPSQLNIEASPTDPTTNVTVLTAVLKDVPLTVLPGQGDVFRRYAAKWLFNRGPEGLKTSVRGHSDARALIHGFGALNLTGLPVEGTFYVGAKHG